MMKRSFLPVLCLALLPTLNAVADVRLPALFSDHMVLQAGARVPVWGWADPGERVTISVGDQRRETTADAHGQWQVRFEPLPAGQTLTLTARGHNQLTVQDVLTGEVWLGSGQSNMELPVSKALNSEAECAAACYPQLRMFTVQKRASLNPQADCKGSWQVCNSNTVGSFSAVLYFFGRQVQEKLGTPMGLIHASWGGTPIQSWTSLEAQRRHPELLPLVEGFEKSLLVPFDRAKAEADYRADLVKWTNAVALAKAQGKAIPGRPVRRADPHLSEYSPGNLFNGMIAPLISYSLRGALWYQGEANGAPAKAPLYRVQLPALVQDWRTRWGQGDFPFAWAQLPNFLEPQKDPGAPSGWALVREAMLESLKLPQTGMGVNIDIGEADNIHPRNKQEVGRRLACWALADVYHQGGVSSGPLFSACQFSGDQATVSFTHTDGGLVARGGAMLGFAVADAQKQWHWAEAHLEGDKVIVSSPEVAAPVAVRYAWADNPACNLYNGAGLPASPFRTDCW